MDDEIDDEIYERQKELPLSVPSSAAIIGCGGVGSWAGLGLALAGVPNLYLVDHDRVEKSNLNRTPYRECDVGIYKVNALAALIAERRKDTRVRPIVGRIEKISFLLNPPPAVVVDCRDTLNPPLTVKAPEIIRIGYDGLSLTIHLYPSGKDIVWGEPTTYRTTPSFVVPACIAGMLIVEAIVRPPQKKEEKIWNREVDDFLVPE